MAFTSGFFNAILDSTSGQYLPRYDAAQFARKFSLYFTNGIFYNNGNALQVSAAGGLKLQVAAGAVNINGYEGINDALTEIQLEAADSIYPRYDGVVVRLDLQNKKIDLHIIKGVASTTPTAPTIDNLSRNSNIYDLLLAYVYINAGATSITNANITDTRGNSNVCGFVTGTVNQLSTSAFWQQWQAAFNEYAEQQESAFNIWWDSIKSTLATIDASALIVRQDELENKFEKITKYQYVCNGKNDNVLLSNLVQGLLAADKYQSINIEVVGDFGLTEPVDGVGTSTNWYKWLKLGTTGAESKTRVNIDFSNASAITVPVKAGLYNTVISGGDIHLTGLNIIANKSATNTAVRIFDNWNLPVEVRNSRFWITAHKESYIARHGMFENCRGSVANVTGNSYCFFTYSAGLLRVIGGEYYAYTGQSNATSAVVGQTEGAGASVLYAVNCPTVTRGGFYQTNAVNITTGVSSVTDLLTTLALVATGANVRGTLVINRPNMG